MWIGSEQRTVSQAWRQRRSHHKAPWAMRTSGSSAADKYAGMCTSEKQITDDNSVTTSIPLM
jgi:hypothetical protein